MLSSEGTPSTYTETAAPFGQPSQQKEPEEVNQGKGFHIRSTFGETVAPFGQPSQQKRPKAIDQGNEPPGWGKEPPVPRFHWTPSLIGGWEEPNIVDQEQRMRVYIDLLSATSWAETKSIIGNIHDVFYVGVAIHDMPELYRYRAINHLNAWREKTINRIITVIQCNKDKYDPDSIFPIVATDEFMETLPDRARQCCVCFTSFNLYENIIWKACGKHTLHSYCLRSLLEANELPLFGPCGCYTAGYDNWRLKMPDTGIRRKKSMIKHFGWNQYEKRSGPVYWT
ncbi:hypothetical protein ACJZ2D_017170 [Fusarium nematophilum]